MTYSRLSSFRIQWTLCITTLQLPSSNGRKSEGVVSQRFEKKFHVHALLVDLICVLMYDSVLTSYSSLLQNTVADTHEA